MNRITATEKFELLVLDYIAGRFASFESLKARFSELLRKLTAIARTEHIRRIEAAYWIALNEMGFRYGI